MPSPCPRCGKPVYLVDELRCLEKVWHKDCFRCLTCNRLLTILTYSGFDKQPYCEQHLPEAKHTSVADSFATRHAKEAARLQSLLEYRKEYEATKGDKISVADDVLTRRLLANARNVGPAQRCWNRERKRAMDDDPDQVTAEDDVMAPAPEECIVLGPIDEHQDQSRPLTHSEATPSCSADPARTCVALADSEGATPEFKKGDYIASCEPAGGGYVFGTVLRTGQRGLVEGHKLMNVAGTGHPASASIISNVLSMEP